MEDVIGMLNRKQGVMTVSQHVGRFLPSCPYLHVSFDIIIVSFLITTITISGSHYVEQYTRKDRRRAGYGKMDVL